MAAGASYAEYEYFNMASTLTKGLWYLGIEADHYKSVAETSETDNITWIAFYIV